MTLFYENELDREGGFAPAGIDFDPEHLAADVIRGALDLLDCPYESMVSLLITGEDEIREMNRDARGIDRVTDVLSFPLLEFESPGDFSFLEEEGSDLFFDPDSGELNLGDIVICWPKCVAQAEEYGHGVRREFAFLTAHSILHLSGFDHMTPEQEKAMFTLQEEILQKLGIVQI